MLDAMGRLELDHLAMTPFEESMSAFKVRGVLRDVGH